MNPDSLRYTVTCQKYLAATYAGVVDIRHCDTIAKELYRLLIERLTGPNGEVHLDAQMVTLALTVHRMAHAIDCDLSNPNQWAPDAFPEFCSLIGPQSGFLSSNAPRADTPSLVKYRHRKEHECKP